MSGQAIYESFANNDMRVLTVGAYGTARISRNYQDRTDALGRLATAMQRAWQGEAAGAARRSTDPLIVGHAMATPQINNAATSMQQQAEAFETAKNSVVPVPPMPEKPGFFDNMISLGNTTEHHEQQVAAIQSANDRNVAIMAQYEAVTRQNQAMLSEIPNALKPSGDSGLTPPPASPNSGPYAIPLSGSGGQSGRSGQSRGGPTTTSGPPPAQPSAPPASPIANTGLGQTHAESAQPSPRPSLLDSGSPKPTTPAPLPEGPKPGLPLGPVGGGYRPGVDLGRGGAPGGPRGYGAGNLGEPGGRGGIGARGPAVAEGAAGRAAAAGRAGGPGSGVPLGAGARNQEQQDLEHRRPAFLVESDPDEIFGSDEAAAPPVIGA